MVFTLVVLRGDGRSTVRFPVEVTVEVKYAGNPLNLAGVDNQWSSGDRDNSDYLYNRLPEVIELFSESRADLY